MRMHSSHTSEVRSSSDDDDDTLFPFPFEWPSSHSILATAQEPEKLRLIVLATDGHNFVVTADYRLCRFDETYWPSG